MIDETQNLAGSAAVEDAGPMGFMLDLETMDTSPTAVILQIGVVPFSLANPLISFPGQLLQLPVQPQLDMNRTISAATLRFWLEQSGTQLPLLQSLGQGTQQDMKESLERLAYWLDSWIQHSAGVELWAKGSGFDARLLQSLFEQFDIEWPFDFRTLRDLRTLLAVADVKTSDVARSPEETAHHALADARYQIRQYVYAMNKLNSAGN